MMDPTLPAHIGSNGCPPAPAPGRIDRLLAVATIPLARALAAEGPDNTQ